MFLKKIRRPKGVNIDYKVEVTPMSSAVPDTISWRRNMHLVRGRLYWGIQQLFSVFVTVICILCVACSGVSPHQVVQNLLPLWSWSCCMSYWAFPAYRTWLLEKSLPATAGHPLWVNLLVFSWRAPKVEARVAQESKAEGAKQGAKQNESVATQFHLLQ